MRSSPGPICHSFARSRREIPRLTVSCDRATLYHILNGLSMYLFQAKLSDYNPNSLSSAIIRFMVRRKKKKVERPVFDSIRKPTAPPSRHIGSEALEEKRHPSLRKIKHKKDPDPNE